MLRPPRATQPHKDPKRHVGRSRRNENSNPLSISRKRPLTTRSRVIIQDPLRTRRVKTKIHPNHNKFSLPQINRRRFHNHTQHFLKILSRGNHNIRRTKSRVNLILKYTINSSSTTERQPRSINRNNQKRQHQRLRRTISRLNTIILNVNRRHNSIHASRYRSPRRP